jgi:DNA-directed RNA polymerase subunit M/transcription elongation factor TFIIS
MKWGHGDEYEAPCDWEEGDDIPNKIEVWESLNNMSNLVMSRCDGLNEGVVPDLNMSELVDLPILLAEDGSPGCKLPDAFISNADEAQRAVDAAHTRDIRVECPKPEGAPIHDVKRFYLDSKVHYTCPECGAEGYTDLAQQPLSYPEYNTSFRFRCWCDECQHEWKSTSQLRLHVELEVVDETPA